MDEWLAFGSLEDDRSVCAREDSEDGIEKVMRGEDDNGLLMLSRLGNAAELLLKLRSGGVKIRRSTQEPHAQWQARALPEASNSLYEIG